MYKLFFQDGTEFKGGHYSDSKWLSAPNNPIIKLEYEILGQTITLEEYEGYNHLVEKITILQQGKKIITKVILMVRKGNDVMKLICDLRKKEIYPDVANFGKEYQGSPTTGWKKGILGGKVKTTII